MGFNKKINLIEKQNTLKSIIEEPIQIAKKNKEEFPKKIEQFNLVNDKKAEKIISIDNRIRKLESLK